MRIIADRDVCVSAGMCVLTVPEVFDQDEEDGLVTILVADPPEELRDHVTEAVQICPSGAITVE